MKNKIEGIKKINIHIVLVVLLLVQGVFMLWYGNMKSGYFVDEIWSYGLSNSYYHAQIWEDGALDETKVDTKMFEDYLVVNDGEEFSYGSVIYNQTHDSHPPLFYIVLHTISSFFPGEFNKWFGIIPNIFYFLVAQVFLYKIGKLFTQNKFFPLMALLLLGFNIAAVNMVTYIRMYMLMTTFALIFSYFHLKTILNKKIVVSDWIMLFVSVAGGMLTHYFFVIFAFPWVVIFLIWLISRKQWKYLAQYVFCGGFSGGAVCLFYPTYISNILGEREGHSSNMYNNLSNLSDWGDKIKFFYQTLSSQIFGNLLTPILYVCVGAVVFYVITHVLWKVNLIYDEERYKICIRSNIKDYKVVWEIRREYYLIAATAFASVFYFLIVSKITTFLSDRYMMCVFPLLVELFCLLLYWIFKVWRVIGFKRITAMLICIVLIGGLTYFSNDPGYIYPEKKNNVEISRKYGKFPCLYLYTSSYMMINNALELVNYDDFYQMYYEDITVKYNKLDVKDEMVLYLDKDMNYNTNNDKMTLKECLHKVESLYGFDEHTQLYEDDKVVVYFLEK